MQLAASSACVPPESRSIPAADGAALWDIGQLWDPYVRRPPFLEGLTRTPSEVSDITGVVRARSDDGTERQFAATVRLDTATEALYFRHGGILPYVARSLV